MNILIHSLETGLYLAEDNRWVKGIKEARDFLQASAAIKYASACGMENVEVTYAFANDEYNINIPIGRPDSSVKQSRP